MARRIALIPAVLCALVVAACGGSDGGTAAPQNTQGGGTAAPAASSTEAKADGVPDACTLISSAELSQIFGSDQGTGQTRGSSPDRSICMYPTGTITAVEIAGNFEASRGIIEDQGRQTQDIPGLGTAAFYDEAGQVVAKGDEVFVGVTAFGVDVEKLKAAAAKMLEAAG